jgi:predicted dehydrogenase
VRVAIIGAGRMGEAHAEAWRALAPEAEVVAVVGRREPATLLAAPGAPGTTDLDGVLADPAVELVSICTPTGTHLDLAARALAAGKHVLLEKPLALTVADGERLVELGRRAGPMLMVAHVVRFFPGYAAVRELVELGRLGAVREVRADRLAPADGRPAWLDDETRSGGFLLDLAVHDFDQLLLLLGPARRVEARHAADGTAEVTVQHTGGGVGRVRAGWDLPPSFPFTTLLEVTGERGSARYAAAAGGRSELVVDAAAGSPRTRVDPGAPYTAQARAFLECIRSGTPPLHGDPAASLAAVRLALAAREALASGAPVDLG